jgi:hypothetical protein
MSDPTENIRREMVQEINADTSSRDVLEQEHGKTWTTDELSKDFEVLGFMAPFVVVKRKSDGVKGSLMFRHSPRIYYGFQQE